jgi:hypothetical protein
MSDLSRSDLPDVYIEPQGDGFGIVANRKGRRQLNKWAEPHVPWRSVGGDWPSEYQTLPTRSGRGARLLMTVVIHELHDAGLRVAFKCLECDEVHWMSDDWADHFRAALIAIPESGPEHPTVQQKAKTGSVPQHNHDRLGARCAR